MYSWKYFIFLLVLLGVANFAAHGHALWDGLFLDDHWHALRLAENDWSIRAFFESTTIEPARFMSMWWQDQPASWWYVRPFAVFVAKAVYHLTDGSVKSLHAISILLHALNALMVHHLVLRMTRRRFWAVVAALLLVVYSHSVYAVAWLAAQNAILQTTLTLAALLLYVRASGLNLYAGPRDENETLELEARPIPPLRWPSMLGVLLCWVLALLSRESAVVLPVFVIAFDLCFGGRRHALAHARLYAGLMVIAAAFTLWRVVFFDHPMPDFYVQRPAAGQYGGYVLWWLTKLMHYTTSVIWLSPMSIGPSGRFQPWRETPGDIVLMLIILGVMTAGYWASAHKVRGYWIWPLWIFLGLLPVASILATPHNAYLPSVGFAIGMALPAGLRHATRPTGLGRWCTVVATWFLIATTTYMPIYRPMWYSVLAAERMTIEQVMRMPPKPEVRDVFFMNLPFVNIYATYHIDEALGRGPQLGVARQNDPTYRTHVLTYAPDLLRMEHPCRLEQLDAYRFRLSIGGNRPYFSGALGRFLIEGLRPNGGRFAPGDQVAGELFDATVVEADALGVRQIEFAFHQPLASERFCFYLGTPSCAAARVRFAGPITLESATPEALEHCVSVDAQQVEFAADRLRRGDAQAACILFNAAENASGAAGQTARAAIEEVCRPVAHALGAPVLEITPSGLAAWADWRESARWWLRHVDDELVKNLPHWAEGFQELRWKRDALFRIRQIASTIIQADLYLTGPPFPGPR